MNSFVVVSGGRKKNKNRRVSDVLFKSSESGKVTSPEGITGAQEPPTKAACSARFLGKPYAVIHAAKDG